MPLRYDNRILSHYTAFQDYHSQFFQDTKDVRVETILFLSDLAPTELFSFEVQTNFKFIKIMKYYFLYIFIFNVGTLYTYYIQNIPMDHWETFLLGSSLTELSSLSGMDIVSKTFGETLHCSKWLEEFLSVLKS